MTSCLGLGAMVKLCDTVESKPSRLETQKCLCPNSRLCDKVFSERVATAARRHQEEAINTTSVYTHAVTSW